MTLTYDLEATPPRKAALGLILLSIDETIERDFRRLLPADVALYHSRVPSSPDLTAETIRTMEATLPEAAALLPRAAGLEAVGYGCTSGATVLGEAEVARMIAASHPGTPATNPLTALKAACDALGVKRLGLVSPYVEDVSESLRAALEAHGVAVTAFGSFGQKEERLVARIAKPSIIEAMTAIGSADGVDAVFASCTNLRAVDVLAEVEAALGKPALASNQVLAWHMLRLAGVGGRIDSLGALAGQPIRS